MESARPTNQPTVVLSERQWAVLSLLGQGLANKEIARQLTLSKNVVDKMLSNGPSHYAIYPKLPGVTNAKGAVAWYLQHMLHATTTDEPPVALQRVAEVSVSAPHDTPQLLYLTILGTAYICLILLLFVRIWLRPVADSQDNIWANTFLIIPAMAGFYGLRYVHGTGTGLSARERRAWRIFSAGLMCWAVGATISAVYSAFTGWTAPYPSVADFGYFLQTACQTVAFVLLWWKSYRRGAQRAWLWPLITLPLVALYLASTFAVHDPRADLAWQPLQLLLDLFYAFGDSASLAIAVCLVLTPNMVRLPTPLQRATRFLTAGMALMFLSGWAFMVTSYLPDGHVLKFSNGNPVDLVFATAFLLMGIAIGLVPQNTLSDARQPAALVD
jgi:hypothetical protein